MTLSRKFEAQRKQEFNSRLKKLLPTTAQYTGTSFREDPQGEGKELTSEQRQAQVKSLQAKRYPR